MGIALAPPGTGEAHAAEISCAQTGCPTFDIGEIKSVKGVDPWWTERRKNPGETTYYQDGYGNGSLFLEASPGQGANGDPANKGVQNNDKDRIQTRDRGDQQPAPERGKWKFATNGNGSFTIRNNESGKCLDATVDQNWSRVSQADCNVGDSQNWYIQPSGDAYVIRHVKDDRCIDMVDGHTSPGTEVQIHPCAKNWQGEADAQKWRLPEADGSVLSALATKYALKQINEKSTAVSGAYRPDSTSEAALGKAERVSDVIDNKTTEPMTKERAWTQTTGYTYTNGGSVTTTASVEVGGEDSVVKATFSLAVMGKWENSWMNSSTASDKYTMTIKPYTYGWMTRAPLVKKVTGTWVFSTDRDTQWWGDGTATAPAKDGTDGKSSHLVACSSDSTDPYCKETDPYKV
ncbi:RICIN domain-containing protein [Streptomyces platensis]|uniref:RICIN domain-containing protein n=1 Tax=Streptomyces platensis TaxID=58346 RepID=UPI0036C8BD57